MIPVAPAFVTSLAVERVGDDELWTLTKPLVFRSKVADTVFVVPVGFRTNFVTGREVPGVAWLAGTLSEEAAAVHDRLYGTHEVDRAMADKVYLEALGAKRQAVRAAEKARGVSSIRRGLSNVIDVVKHRMMYIGLRIGGGRNWGEDPQPAPVEIADGSDHYLG